MDQMNYYSLMSWIRRNNGHIISISLYFEICEQNLINKLNKEHVKKIDKSENFIEIIITKSDRIHIIQKTKSE